MGPEAEQGTSDEFPWLDGERHIPIHKEGGFVGPVSTNTSGKVSDVASSDKTDHYGQQACRDHTWERNKHS